MCKCIIRGTDGSILTTNGVESIRFLPRIPIVGVHHHVAARQPAACLNELACSIKGRYLDAIVETGSRAFAMKGTRLKHAGPAAGPAEADRTVRLPR